MNDIKSLLTNNVNPQARLMAETRGLQQKWDKTGLLEGVEGIEKANMSILLENQAQQLLSEATATGTSGNSEQWAGVALPLVRRVFAEIAAKEFVSVQPMNLPSGLIFYLDFKYGTTTGGKTSGDSLFGGNRLKLGSTDDAVKGLYGVGAGAYTTKQTSSLASYAVGTSSVQSANFVASASAADINYDATITGSGAVGNLAGYWKLTVPLATNDGTTFNATNGIVYADLTAVRSWYLSGAYTTFGAYNKVVNTGSLAAPYYQAILIVSGSMPTTVTVNYTKQPTDSTRFDFEDNTANTFAAASTSDTGLNKDIGIPEVNLELKSEPIVAKTRKLKAVWTPELAQDLNAYHSIDAEAELTALLSEYVSMEIDLEILDMLISAAPAVTTEAWSCAVGTEFTNKTVNSQGQASWTVRTDTTNRTAYVKSTWFQTLGNKIQKVSNKIHQLTLRGGANFLVVSPDVATILESIPGYVVNTDGDSAKFAMGVSKVGSFASRFQVYKNPYMVENVILVGFRGNNFLETGAVYAPYIPLVQTPLVYDPVNFTPRRGVLTRYAKKVVRPEFFGKLIIADLDQV